MYFSNSVWEANTVTSPNRFLTRYNFYNLSRLDPEPDDSVDAVEETPDIGSNDPPQLVDETPDVGNSQEACDFLGSSRAAGHSGAVNWEELQIENTFDREGEGMLDIINEDQLFRLLGLRDEGDQHDKPSEADAQAAAERDSIAENRTTDIDIDITGAAIPVDDHVPREGLYAYDPNNPSMDIGTMYPNMQEFRLAMKQFAINKEFEYRIVKTDPTRYIANCKDDACSWHINGRRQPDGSTVKVYNYLLFPNYMSPFFVCIYLIFLLFACCRLQL